MGSYERPRSPLTKTGQRRQTTLCRRRECDREWRASESAGVRELHCSLRRQRDRDRHEARSAQQREDRLQQQQQCVRELRASETPQEREAHLQQDGQRVRERRAAETPHSRHLFIPFLDTLFPLYVHSHHGLSKIIQLYTHPQYSLLISYVLAQACPTMIYIH